MSTMDEQTILKRLETMCAKSSLRKVAVDLGISAPYLSDVLRRNRLPGPKLLKKLGIKRTVQRIVSYQPTNGR